MWYVIHTVSGMEQKCLQQCGIHLDRDDYNEIFIPRYIAQKHFKKEWHEVEKALFPGYLFVDTEKIESVIEGLKKFRQYTKVLREGEMVSPITVQEQQFLSIMMDQQHLVRYSEGFLIGIYQDSGSTSSGGKIGNTNLWSPYTDRSRLWGDEEG